MSERARVALVTGGAHRLGAAISRTLADAGFRVLVHAHRHAAEAETLATSLGGDAIVADLLSPGAPEALVEAALARTGGRLDALVNNAALFERHEADRIPADAFARHLTLNLAVPFRLAQLCAPALRAAGRGCIVNLLDISALRPYRGYAHYSATKAGLLALTAGLAAEWGPEIRVNGVAPGAALLPESQDDPGDPHPLARSPLGRETGAQAVADAVRFLVDGPAEINGVVLPVDGGRSARW